MDDREAALAIGRARYSTEPTVEPMPGMNSAVFRLWVGGSAKILKLASSEDASSLRRELGTLELLAAHGVPAAVVEHHDIEGALVGRPWLIMTSAGDKTVADCIARQDPATPDLFAQMGGVLARIHAITVPAAGPTRDLLRQRDRAAVLETIARSADALVRADLLTTDEVVRFQRLPLPPFEGHALCHGDFHSVQCVVDDHRITAVVDWDSAWAGNADVDLGVTHAYFDFYAKPDLVNWFLDGYAAVRPLAIDHADRSLPTRMSHALFLASVWLGRNKMPGARRAVALFRTYVAAWERG